MSEVILVSATAMFRLMGRDEYEGAIASGRFKPVEHYGAVALTVEEHEAVVRQFNGRGSKHGEKED